MQSILNTLAGLIPGMALKDRIQELVDAGHKKSQLAKAAGKSPASVTHWLNGETHEIKSDSAAGLQALTGFSAVWIATGKGPKYLTGHQKSEPAPSASAQATDAHRNLDAVLTSLASHIAEIDPSSREALGSQLAILSVTPDSRDIIDKILDYIDHAPPKKRGAPEFGAHQPQQQQQRRAA